jgi:hypothetical protein
VRTRHQVEFDMKFVVPRSAESTMRDVLYSEFGRLRSSVLQNRSFLYFDFPGVPLAGGNASFRRVCDKPSYCFKRPLGIVDGAQKRMEVFTFTDGLFLDPIVALHRAAPVFSAAANYLAGTGFEPGTWEGFGPVARIDVARQLEFAWGPHGDRAYALCWDGVRAIRLADGTSAEWTEVELETHSNAPEGEATIRGLARRLRQLGFAQSSDCKYRTALAAIAGSAGAPQAESSNFARAAGDGAH